MNWELLDDTELVKQLYKGGNEDTRLNRSKSKRVEFLTNVHYIEKYLHAGAKILDIGAGAGEYSLYFAKKGCEVSALELSEDNIRAFRKKLSPADRIDLVQGNALDLSRYEEGSFDIVLLFGPLYHLRKEADRLRCIAEAKRVCKKDGVLFFAFISNDMLFLTEFLRDPQYFSAGAYDKDTFKLQDFPFVFHTVDACRALLADSGVRIVGEIASDGASELLEEQIDRMDNDSYAHYLRYHFYICEKPEFLGMSNHVLFIGRKEE